MEAVKKNCLKMLKKEKIKRKDREILNINIVNTQDAAAFINLLKPYDYKIVKIIKKNDLFLAKINNHYHGGFVFYIALSSLDFKLKCFKRYIQDNLEDQKSLKMRNITFDFKLREKGVCGISETKKISNHYLILFYFNLQKKDIDLIDRDLFELRRYKEKGCEF